MGWVNWLKGFSARELPEPAAVVRPRAAGAQRQGRRPGDAFAKEWVKVLEDSDPAREAASTYAWELQPDADTGSHRRAAQPTPQAAARGRGDPRSGQADPFDTYTWELHETDSADDPWGLKKDAPRPPPTPRDGINPYDTGVFDASWTGKFDNR